MIVGVEGAVAQAASAAIYTLLRDQLGHDFSGYKPKTFIRRVQRRMQIAGLPGSKSTSSACAMTATRSRCCFVTCHQREPTSSAIPAPSRH